ncbi:MAG: hypothetical protein AB7P01_11135 [Bacteroidia bacterium]
MDELAQMETGVQVLYWCFAVYFALLHLIIIGGWIWRYNNERKR